MPPESCSNRIERRLTTFFPSTALDDHAEAVGVAERDGKFQVPAMVWALVFGLRRRQKLNTCCIPPPLRYCRQDALAWWFLSAADVAFRRIFPRPHQVFAQRDRCPATQRILKRFSDYLGYSPPPLLDRMIADAQKTHQERPIP